MAWVHWTPPPEATVDVEAVSSAIGAIFPGARRLAPEEIIERNRVRWEEMGTSLARRSGDVPLPLDAGPAMEEERLRRTGRPRVLTAEAPGGTVILSVDEACVHCEYSAPASIELKLRIRRLLQALGPGIVHPHRRWADPSE